MSEALPSATQGESTVAAAYATLGQAFARLDAAARADSTVGQSRQVGERTIIPLAEVFFGGGFGLGGGQAPEDTPAASSGAAPEDTPAASGGGAPRATVSASSGVGGGGGFGGRVRPVAVVDVGPEGVRVRPVVDATALGLALIPIALGALVGLWRQRAQKG
jgi:uncharacterized spore protein YtfJ